MAAAIAASLAGADAAPASGSNADSVRDANCASDSRDAHHQQQPESPAQPAVIQPSSSNPASNAGTLTTAIRAVVLSSSVHAASGCNLSPGVDMVNLLAADLPSAAAPTTKRKSGVMEDPRLCAASSAATEDNLGAESGRGGTDPSTAALPPEPPAGVAGVLELAVRLPDGQRAQRRFVNSDTVAAVETWLRGKGQDINGRILSRQWPRKVSTSISRLDAITSSA